MFAILRKLRGDSMKINIFAKRMVTMKKIALATIMMLLIPIIAQATVTVGDVVKHIPADVAVQAGASTTDLNKNIITLSFSLTSNLTNDVLSSITIDDLGTLASGDADLKVYVNPLGRNSTRGAFLVVNQPSWSAASGTINFTRNIPLTQNVKAYVFIVYDLRSSAAGKTLQTSVASIGLASGSGSGSSVSVNQTSNTNSIVAKTACYDDVKLNQCGMCHNYQGYYQMFYPHSSTTSRKGHEKHVGLNRFECFICHNQANLYNTRYTSIAPQHMNNTIDVGPKIWDNVSSSGGLGVGYGTYNPSTRVCSNVYCHSNGAGTRVNSPAWGTTASGCTVCHGTPPTTGAHNAHWTSITGLTSPTDCGICHLGGGTGSFHHADGHIDVYFDPAYNERNLTATYNTGTKTCSNVRCHGGITTPAWNSATGAYRQTVSGASFTSENKTWLKCEMCHNVDNIASGNETNITRWNTARSGKHYAHAVTQLAAMKQYSGVVDGVNYGRKRLRVSVCYVCHNNAHYNTTVLDYRWTKAAISDYHFSTNPGGTGNTIGGSAARDGGTVGPNIFDLYSDNSTTAVALNTSPTQNVYYMAASANYQSGSCANTACHGSGVWSYTATLDCTTCHSKTLSGRTANVVAEFNMASHHVQGVTVNSQHCYRCHWEADNNAGTIVKNSTYHGDNKSQLVIYDSTNNARPTTANSATLVVFNRATSATSLRANAHCLSCHNEGGKGKAIFPGDTRTTNQYAWDGSSIYARYMIYKSYSSHIYNPTTYNVVPYKVKTSSSHYYMNKHQRGVAVGAVWSDDSPTTPAPGTFDAAGNQGSVGCLDCHNSHGSNIPFGTFGYTSYSSFTGKYKGGILKQTWANTHGYGADYTPTERNLNVTGGLWAVWSAQAALCFDCHLGPDKAITAYLGSAYASWSSVTTLPPDSRGIRRDYRSYGRNTGNIVAGYYDAVNYELAVTNRASIHGRGRWYIDLNTANTTYGTNGYSYVEDQRNNSAAFWFGEFKYKRGTIIGTHFKKYNGAYVQGYTPRDWKNSANSGNIHSDLRGMCTKCHDPHGVNAMAGSPYLANIRYYSPQLKGMWLTGLYYEDRPGDRNTSNFSEGTYLTFITFGSNTVTNTRVAPRIAPTKRLNRPRQTGNGYGYGLNDGFGQDGFFIDDNTFGVTVNNGTNALELFTSNNYNIASQNFWFNNWVNGQVHAFRTGVGSVTVNIIQENENQFAGLCLGCHPKSVLINSQSSHNNRRASFVTHAHKTVKGWASTAGSPANADIVPNYYINRASTAAGLTNAYTANNNFGNISMSQQFLYANGGTAGIRGLDAPNMQVGYHISWGLHLPKQADTTAGNNIQVQYHNFPCSKCHTPHTSRLPRLMKTNCLDVRQSANVNNNWASASDLFRQKHTENATNNWYIRMIYTGTNNSPGTTGTTANLLIWNPARATRCHNSPLVKDAVNQTRWNDVTPWGN